MTEYCDWLECPRREGCDLIVGEKMCMDMDGDR